MRLAELDGCYAQALPADDHRALEQLSDQVHEWLQRMAQPILSRALMPFAGIQPRKPWEC